MGIQNTTNGLTEIRSRPATVAAQEKWAERTRGRTDMASSGLTHVARQAGRNGSRQRAAQRRTPESAMHQNPSETPIGKRAGRRRTMIPKSPQPASSPPPQPTSPRNMLSRAIMAATWAFVQCHRTEHGELANPFVHAHIERGKNDERRARGGCRWPRVPVRGSFRRSSSVRVPPPRLAGLGSPPAAMPGQIAWPSRRETPQV